MTNENRFHMDKKRNEPLKEPDWLNKIDSNPPEEDMKPLGTGSGQNKAFFLPKKKKVKIDHKAAIGNGQHAGISNHSKAHQHAIANIVVKLSNELHVAVIPELRIALVADNLTFDLIPDILVYRNVSDELPVAIVEIIDGDPGAVLRKYESVLKHMVHAPAVFSIDIQSSVYSRLDVSKGFVSEHTLQGLDEFVQQIASGL
jgi:hypothetical protein